jgi:molecular chaperone DnaK
MPQIEVTFDIDANGILNVSAKDKASGKEQKIVIQASSGLSDDEVERMVSDAAVHEEEDKKFRELVDVRNQADALLHSSEKSLEDLGEKVTAEERSAIEAASNDVKEALKSDDKDSIETKLKALSEASAGLAQRVYEEAAAAEGAEGAEGTAAADDGVVDAEFEEVEKEEQEEQEEQEEKKD